MVKRQLTQAECPRAVYPRRTLTAGKKGGAARDNGRRGTGLCLSLSRVLAGRQLVRQRARYESSGAHAAFKIALRQELSVSVEDRNARDPQFRSENSSGGNL